MGSYTWTLISRTFIAGQKDRIAELEAENVELKELLVAARPLLHSVHKAGWSEVYADHHVDPKYKQDNEKGDGYLSTYAIFEAVKRITNQYHS